jgi:hypothetical protein
MKSLWSRWKIFEKNRYVDLVFVASIVVSDHPVSHSLSSISSGSPCVRQTELARVSATDKAQQELDLLENDSIRLDQAEASISSMLDRVNQETAVVNSAVDELKRAQVELNRDFIFKLKSGGIVKQGSLVGFVLFSIRSIVDSVASFNDESQLVPAMAQAAIAVLCAAYFFLL